MSTLVCKTCGKEADGRTILAVVGTCEDRAKCYFLPKVVQEQKEEQSNLEEQKNLPWPFPSSAPVGKRVRVGKTKS